MLLASAPGAVQAIFEVEEDDYYIDAIGSLRLMSAFLHYPQLPEPLEMSDEGIGTGVTRLILDGDLGENLSFEVNGYADLSRGPDTSLVGTFSTAGSFQSPYRFKYLAWDFWEQGSVNGQLGLDRLNLSYSDEPWTITAGRFPINYSVMHIFTPNDLFSPFSSTAINKIYKPGVDALRLGVSTGMLSMVELFGVLGYGVDRAPEWNSSALVLRASAVLLDFDWALMGGKLAERWFGGVSLQGDVEEIGVRAEGHVGFPDIDGDLSLDDIDHDGDTSDDVYVHLSAGLDKVFTWHNSTIGAEYMYLSDGTARPSRYPARVLRLFPDDQFYLGKHYLGLSVGGEIIPILRTNALALLNANDYSGLCVLILAYSVADEAELVAGTLIPWGKTPEQNLDLSEPGSLIVFIETRSYF
jgi:hypothetical protein